jgi:hypothetical protein
VEGRARYSAEVKRAVGIELKGKGRLRRGELARWAGMLEASPRKLRKWRDQAKDCPAMGRPRHAQESSRPGPSAAP